MVSTRRSGSISGNNSKRSSSSEDKSSSPKRQKVDNGSASEKSTQAENSKELSSPPAVDLPECGAVDPPTADEDGGGEAVKEEAAQAVSVATPIAEGSSPVVDKPRSSFSSWTAYQKQNPSFETSTPWCRLLSQYAQNSNVSICISNFTVGASRHTNLVLKDQTNSAILCVIKNAQREGTSVALLESRGSKGSVQVNGKIIKKGTSCVLNSGDEVVFGLSGNHAYIFQQLSSEVVKAPSSVGGTEVQSKVGKLMHVERRAGDPSAVAGASILASLSSLRQDLSRLKSTAQSPGKALQGAELPPLPIVHDSMEVDLDGLEVNSTTDAESDKAADIGATSKMLSIDANLDSGIEAGNVFEERNEWARDSLPASTSGMSLRCAAFKEDIHAGIIDGKEIEVSFEDFPYYLSENTKSVLIAASYIHLKHREQVKYTSEFPTVNPRFCFLVLQDRRYIRRC